MSIDITTIGIALETSGLEKGARALGDAEKAANRAADAADKVSKASTNAASSYDAVKAAVSRFSTEEAKYVQKLVDEYKQLGMNRSQMEAYRAAQSGMSKGAQEMAAAVGAKIDAYKREQAAMEASSRGMSDLASAGRMVGGALASIGLGLSARELLKLADASTNVESRLRLVTKTTEELSSVQQRLFSVAQNARVNFVDLVGTYAQLARSTKDLGLSQSSLLGVVNTVSQAVTISGGSAESARAALTQLSQGFAAGALRGDELNSVLEQTPRLAQAIADGLGVSIGQLRALGAAGELTAEKVLGALERSAASVSTEFGKMAMTVEQASTQASNSVLTLVGAIDKLTGGSKAVSSAISAIATGVDALSQDIQKLGSQGPLRDAAREVLSLDEAANRLRAGMQNGVFNPNAQEELKRINAQLDAAKQKFNALHAAIGGVIDPRDQSGYTSRSTSYANEAKRQAKLAEDANTFRLNQAGISPAYIKDMAELIRLNQAGVIVGKEYNEALKAQQAILMKKSGATAAAHKEESAANKELEAQAKLMAELSGLSGTFAADWARLNALYAKGELSLDGLTEAQGKLLAKQPAISAAIKEEEEARKLALKTAQATADARNKEIDGINAWLAAQEQAAAQALASVTDRVRSLADEEEAARMASAMNISLAEAVELVTIARLKEKRAQQFNEGSEAWEAVEREIEAREKLLDQLGRKDIREREERGWADMWSSVDRTAHDVFVNVFEGGSNVFKKLGQTLKASVLDVLYQMTVRKWIIQIGTSIFGGGFGMAANAATGGGGALGTIGSIGSGYSLLSGMGAFGGGLAGGFGGFMGSLGLSGAGTTIGGAMSAGGIAMGAGNIMGGLGTIIGALGPIALGLSLLGGLFSRKLKDSGIEGTFGGETGFEGRSYRFYEGGLLRSDKTTYDALDEQVRKTLGDTYKSMREQTAAYADALGLSTERLAGFTSTLKLSLHGLSDADAQKKLQEALATANDELAQQVLGTWKQTTETVRRRVASTAMEMEAGADAYREVEETITQNTYTASEFAKEGERASETLKRLATSLGLANTWFARLGATLFEQSLGGADQASGFIDAMGGADAFDAQAGAYFSSYYTSTQRRAAMQREVQDTLGKAGVEMPRSAMEFRELMDAALAAGEAGRETAAALFSVAPAFAEVNGSIADMEQAMGVSADSIKGILDDVRKGAATPAEASQRLEDSIYEGLGNVMTQGLSQMIMSAVVGPLVDGLLTGATGSAAALAAGGVAGGTGAAAGGAAAGGAVAAGGAAAGASMAQGGAIAGAAVASTIEQARAYMDGFAAIMNDPAVRDTIRQIADGFGDIAGDLGGVTGGFQSASTAMQYAGGQAGSMADSVTSLGDSIEEEIKRLRGLMVDDSPGKGRDVLLAEFTTATAQARAGDQSALERLPELSQRLEAATQLTAGSSVELARMRGWLAGSLEETKRGFAAQTDAQRRAAMFAMNEPGYDIRDTPRYANTWSATPIYTPWEEGTVDSRYGHWFDMTPVAGTGNLRGQDPNLVPDLRYSGGGIGAQQYDARDPSYMEDWRYRDTWSADPYLSNPRPSWYGPAYAQGTNYVPEDGWAYLHKAEAVVPAAYNPAAGGGDMAQEMRALRAEMAAFRAEQAAQALDAQRLRLRAVKVQERWETGGMPPARTEGAYT